MMRIFYFFINNANYGLKVFEFLPVWQYFSASFCPALRAEIVFVLCPQATLRLPAVIKIKVFQAIFLIFNP